MSPSKDPDYDSAHLGLSILAVTPLSARAQVLLDEDIKDKAEATVVTVLDVKASKKGPPSPPRTFDARMRLLWQYK